MNRIFFLGLVVLFSCSKSDVDKLKFLERGNTAFEGKDYSQAVSFYNDALSKDSTFVDAWNNKGLALMKLASYDDAIYCFDQAIQHKPQYAEAILNNAKANLAVKQFFAAANHVDQLKKIWPDTSLVFFTDGLINAAMGETEKAMKGFHKVLELDPKHAEAMVNIANLYYHNRRADSAIIYLGEAIKIDPNLSNAYNILAMVYVQQEQYDDALQAITTATSLTKNDPYYINNMGFILLKLERLEEAEESIVISMKIDPYNGWVYRNLGLVRYAQNNYEEAARLLDKALKIDAEIDYIYYDLAIAYRDMGEIENACKLLESAPKHDENEYLLKDLCY